MNDIQSVKDTVQSMYNKLYEIHGSFMSYDDEDCAAMTREVIDELEFLVKVLFEGTGDKA